MKPALSGLAESSAGCPITAGLALMGLPAGGAEGHGVEAVVAVTIIVEQLEKLAPASLGTVLAILSS